MQEIRLILDGGMGVQSDVMMICSINVKTKEVKLVSIYRDTLLKMYSRDEFDLQTLSLQREATLI